MKSLEDLIAEILADVTEEEWAKLAKNVASRVDVLYDLGDEIYVVQTYAGGKWIDISKYHYSQDTADGDLDYFFSTYPEQAYRLVRRFVDEERMR